MVLHPHQQTQLSFQVHRITLPHINWAQQYALSHEATFPIITTSFPLKVHYTIWIWAISSIPNFSAYIIWFADYPGMSFKNYFSCWIKWRFIKVLNTHTHGNKAHFFSDLPVSCLLPVFFSCFAPFCFEIFDIRWYVPANAASYGRYWRVM
jgi:hypothetical protein